MWCNAKEVVDGQGVVHHSSMYTSIREAPLWSAADKLRNNMDAAQYKHVVLGLKFLKYISELEKISWFAQIVGAQTEQVPT